MAMYDLSNGKEVFKNEIAMLLEERVASGRPPQKKDVGSWIQMPVRVTREQDDEYSEVLRHYEAQGVSFNSDWEESGSDDTVELHITDVPPGYIASVDPRYSQQILRQVADDRTSVAMHLFAEWIGESLVTRAGYAGLAGKDIEKFIADHPATREYRARIAHELTGISKYAAQTAEPKGEDSREKS